MNLYGNLSEITDKTSELFINGQLVIKYDHFMEEVLKKIKCIKKNAGID